MKAILIMLLLSGCVSAGYTKKTAGVVGNAVSVTISNVWNASQALPLADEHCAKFDKAARLSNSSTYAFTFDCVKP